MNLLDLAVKVGIKDEVTSKLGALASGVKNGLGAAAKVGAAAIGASVAAAGAGAVALGKTALDSYASYEQLEGGIDKLFGAGGKSLEEYAASVGQSVEQAAGKFDALNAAHDLVMQNAQKAYKTSGMSANEYMEQVSGISAALVSSLGGDTVEAANRADVAMRAISDNVNTFGSDAASVSNAFQGFAKQNYTMLDNLKLGYGGTKTEMERLIADANEWGAANGKASNLSIENFADVVTAIDQIQQKQQIAGTTAREAATTIEGSVNSTKAAWQNLLTELGKDDGDVGARMTELFTSVFGDGTEENPGVFGNILPRVQQIFQSISDNIPVMMPMITQALQTALPTLLETISSMLPMVIGIVTTIATTLAEQLPQLVSSLVPVIISMIPTMVEAGIQLFLGLLQALTQSGPEIMNGMSEAIRNVIQIVGENMPAMLDAAGQLILMLLTAIVQNGPQILADMLKLLVDLVAYVIDHLPEMLDAGAKLIGELVTAIGDAAGDVLDKIGEVVQGAIDEVAKFVDDMLQAGADFIWGFIDGIGKEAGRLIDEAVGAVSGAVDAVLGFLGIASPSKLMKRLGGYTMEGFAEGIENTAQKAEKAMETAAKGVYGAANGEVDLSGVEALEKAYTAFADNTMLGQVDLSGVEALEKAYTAFADNTMLGQVDLSGLDALEAAYKSMSKQTAIDLNKPLETMQPQQTKGVLITGNEFIVRNDYDIELIANAIETRWQREARETL